MNIQKLNIKVLARTTKDIELPEFVAVFQRWIQKDLIPGLLIDVADYSHVKDGPGVMLVAHEFNLGMDGAQGALGLMYNRKQPLDESRGDSIQQVLGAVLEACDLLEKEPSLKGRLDFEAGKLLFLINDRLAAPNNDETMVSVESSLKEVLDNLYSKEGFTMVQEPDAKKRFAVMVEAKKSFSARDLLDKLS